MDFANQYLEGVFNILKDIVSSEEKSLKKAANLIARQVEADRLIHVFGTGAHSIMGAMEVFWRAGGFANVNPLFPAGLSLVDSHPNIERTPELAESVLKFYNVKDGDVLIIVNVNGINSMTIQAAIEAKKIGTDIIAITSPEFANNVPKGINARHPSGINLHELADIVIDVHVPIGDSLLKIKHLEQTVGASSTYAICFAINLLFIQTARILVEKGIEPPIWTSANIKGGDEKNKKYLDAYLHRVHHLYPMF